MNVASIVGGYDLMRERQYLPEEHAGAGFVGSGSFVGTAPERGLDPFSYGRLLSRTPAWQFAGEDHIVFSSRPVTIALSRGEELFFAENETLGIVATGESILDAIEDFGAQLVESYFHYTGLGWDRVTGRAVEVKRFFKDFFRVGRVAGEG